MRARMIAFVLGAFLASSLLLISDARSQWVPPPPFTPAVQMFYGDLAPHGQWVYLAEYGWCWQPNPVLVGAGWAPYTRGHWDLTEAGWTWVSDFSWGWAAFHYGGWGYDDLYGWVWVPDTYWAPAWVEWRFGGGYIGWCPLPPRRVTIARPVTVAHPPAGGWTFVSETQFLAPVHPVDAVTAASIWTRTQPIAEVRTVGGVHIPAGPTVAHVELRVGRTIQQKALVDVHKATPLWSPRVPPPMPVIRPAPPPTRMPPPRIHPPARPKVSQARKKGA